MKLEVDIPYEAIVRAFADGGRTLNVGNMASVRDDIIGLLENYVLEADLLEWAVDNLPNG